MYIFGGFEESIDQFSCDVHCLNLKTMEWHFIHTLGTPPSYRDFHTATVINDRMYIYGGRGDLHAPYHSQEEIYCPKIVYLDLRTNQWVMPATVGKHPIGRRSHSACKYQASTIMSLCIIDSREFPQTDCFKSFNLYPLCHFTMTSSYSRRHTTILVGRKIFQSKNGTRVIELTFKETHLDLRMF